MNTFRSSLAPNSGKRGEGVLLDELSKRQDAQAKNKKKGKGKGNNAAAANTTSLGNSTSSTSADNAA